MVCCVNCEVWWHVDCINNRLVSPLFLPIVRGDVEQELTFMNCVNRHADFSDEPASTSLPLPLCPACQNICSCPRCLNVPPKPRNGRRNLTSGNRSHRKKVPLVVPDQEVEVEERAFESAVLLGERIREERKKGRQRYWERFLDSPSTSSLLDDDGEEDEMEVERVMKAREGSYSSVDSTDEDSEEDGEEYWRGSGGSVSSAETSFVDGASWIGEEGKRRDSRSVLRSSFLVCRLTRCTGDHSTAQHHQRSKKPQRKSPRQKNRSKSSPSPIRPLQRSPSRSPTPSPQRQIAR